MTGSISEQVLSFNKNEGPHFKMVAGKQMSMEVYLPELERTCVNEEGNEWTTGWVSKTASVWVFKVLSVWLSEQVRVSEPLQSYLSGLGEKKIVRCEGHTSAGPNWALLLRFPLATDTSPIGRMPASHHVENKIDGWQWEQRTELVGFPSLGSHPQPWDFGLMFLQRLKSWSC